MSSIMDVVLSVTCISFLVVPVLALLWLMVMTLRLDYRAMGRSVMIVRL